MNNSTELRRLMREHELTRAKVAEHCVAGLSTVDSWLAPPHASWHRRMPDRALQLLTYKLQEK